MTGLLRRAGSTVTDCSGAGHSLSYRLFLRHSLLEVYTNILAFRKFLNKHVELVLNADHVLFELTLIGVVFGAANVIFC